MASKIQYIIKRGDLLPVIREQLRDPDGRPADLTGASSVRFVYRKRDKSQLAVVRTATVINAASGLVEYTWQVDDTALADHYDAEWEVIYSGGRPLTYPNDSQIDLFIPLDLNSDGAFVGVPAGSGRIITRGSTTIGAGLSVDLATFSRQAGERIGVKGWPVDDVAGLAFSESVAASSGLSAWIERTTTANQAKLRGKNADASARTLEWLIYALT